MAEGKLPLLVKSTLATFSCTGAPPWTSPTVNRAAADVSQIRAGHFFLKTGSGPLGMPPSFGRSLRSDPALRGVDALVPLVALLRFAKRPPCPGLHAVQAMSFRCQEPPLLPFGPNRVQAMSFHSIPFFGLP